MTLERIKILPLLVVVAMLAFSVRLADVMTGVSSLSAAALAASQEEPQAGDSEETAASETVAEQEQPETAETTTQSAAEEDGDTDWRAASDDELGYTGVRMEMFEDLVKRRKALDQREKSLTTREALLSAAEQELDRKYQELSRLREEIVSLLGQQSEEETERIASLVKIYEGMKPKDAARIFDTLDLDVLVSVLSKMSERKLSPILAAMNPERARTVTIMLAEQKQLPQLPQSN